MRAALTVFVLLAILCCSQTVSAIQTQRAKRMQNSIQMASTKKHTDTVHALMERTRDQRAAEAAQAHAQLAVGDYFFFFDSGSGGNRAYLYAVTAIGGGNLVVSKVNTGNGCSLGDNDIPLGTVAPNADGVRGLCNAYSAKLSAAGCRSVVGNVNGVITNAIPPRYIDNNLIKFGWGADRVPVFIQATAGMRIVPGDSLAVILQHLNDPAVCVLKPKASVVSGRWEGFYGFFNVVNNAATLMPQAMLAVSNHHGIQVGANWDTTNTIYVEIGGASIQVAFALEQDQYATLVDVHRGFLETDSQVKKPVDPEFTSFLEVQGPMALAKLGAVPAAMHYFYSQSFLGDAGDRMHARTVKNCMARGSAGVAPEYTCPCLALNVDLVTSDNRLVFGAADVKAAGGSHTCFAKPAGGSHAATDNRLLNAGKCKDYSINSPAAAAAGPLITLYGDEIIHGTGVFADCYRMVKGIHDNENDEMVTSLQPQSQPFNLQWGKLRAALQVAGARARTNVIINSGGLYFSYPFRRHDVGGGNFPCDFKTLQANGGINALERQNHAVNFATFDACIAAANTYDPWATYNGARAGNAGDADLWNDLRGTYSAPSVHALVKDILTRLGKYEDGVFYKVVFEDWTKAGSVIAANALNMAHGTLEESNARRLFSGGDAYGVDENAPLNDNDLVGEATVWQHLWQWIVSHFAD